MLPPISFGVHVFMLDNSNRPIILNNSQMYNRSYVNATDVIKSLLS